MKHKRNYLIEERLVGERGEEAGREVDAAVDDEQVRDVALQRLGRRRRQHLEKLELEKQKENSASDRFFIKQSNKLIFN